MTAPVCGERHPSIAGRACTRPEGHKGGHRDEPRDCYWQGEEAEARPYCGAQWPNLGPAGDVWTCTLDTGHEGDHEAHGRDGKPVLDPSGSIPQDHDAITREPLTRGEQP